MSPRISIRRLGGQSDQRLMALVRDGHERAFEALVHRYRRPLLRYCRQTMRLSEARAEDVVQHALLKAWLALTAGTDVRELRPWLFRIVHNAAVNTIRASSERPVEQIEAVAVPAESGLEHRIALRDTLSDIAELPVMQRRAIVLAAVDGHSHDEVAAALGITNGSVRGLLYRARATLRSAAAALTPPSLLSWAGRGGGSGERMLELSGGGAAAGTTGLLLKGAAVAVTAGALATGVAVQNAAQSTHHHAARATRVVRAAPGPMAGAGIEPHRSVSAAALTGGATRSRAGDTVERRRGSHRDRRSTEDRSDHGSAPREQQRSGGSEDRLGSTSLGGSSGSSGSDDGALSSSGGSGTSSGGGGTSGTSGGGSGISGGGSGTSGTSSGELTTTGSSLSGGDGSDGGASPSGSSSGPGETGSAPTGSGR